MTNSTKAAQRVFIACAYCFVIAVMVAGIGCGKEAPAPQDANGTEPSTVSSISAAPGAQPAALTETATEPDKAVVTVNGHEIGEREVDQLVNLQMSRLSGQFANVPPQFRTQIQKQLRQKVVDELISKELITQDIEASGVKISDADVMAELQKRISQQQPPMTLDDFKTRLTAQGADFEQVKADFATGMAYQQIMEGKWADKVDVTDEEAKKYYDENPEKFQTPEQVRASHILIKPAEDPNADPNEAKAVAKQKAEDLLKQVKDGADFATLAQANSDCPSSARGGDLGSFERGKMVPAFEEVAFALDPNQVSDVVETRFGYHIIKTTEHKDATTTPYEEAKADIITTLTSEKKAAISKEYIDSLKEKAKIEYPATETPQASPVPQPTPTIVPSPAPTEPADEPNTPAPAPAPEE